VSFFVQFAGNIVDSKKNRRITF